MAVSYLMSLSRLIIRPSLLPLFLELLLPELLLRGLVGGVAGVLVVSGRPVVVVRVARLLWDGAGGEDLRCIFYLSSTGQTPPLIGSGGSPTFRERSISRSPPPKLSLSELRTFILYLFALLAQKSGFPSVSWLRLMY